MRLHGLFNQKLHFVPITTVLQKDEKNDFLLVYYFLLLLSTLEINHCSQNNPHHRFTK